MLSNAELRVRRVSVVADRIQRGDQKLKVLLFMLSYKRQKLTVAVSKMAFF